MRADERGLASDRVVLTGLGAGQQAVEGQPTRAVYSRVPGEDSEATYYDRPLLKKPVWKAAVPAYFYLGGLAGAAGVLAAAAQLLGGRRLAPLVGKLRLVNLVGTSLGSALLIEDLGRPERFLNMLRVFRPSSPMSVGSWVLALNGTCAAAAVLLPPLAGPAGLACGLLGACQSAYPGVLLACTAVPVWQQSRRSLPGLFVASSAAALGSLAPLIGLADSAAVERLGMLAKGLELVAMRAVERESSSRSQRVASPVRQNSLWKLSGALTAGSLALGLLPGRGRWKKVLAGCLGTAGAVTLRWAVMEAGRASSQDPRASFELQRF